MKKILLILSIGILAASCASSKRIAYFQGIDDAAIENNVGNYEIRIVPDDNLFISVGSINPESAAIFNPPPANSSTMGNDAILLNGYLVDQAGYIDFPVIGRMKVGGMTKAEAAEYLRGRISHYLKEPTVNIRFLNFKVTVLGEVARPGTYDVKSERLTLIEALGLAGDLTIYGKRNNVLVCRDNAGTKHYERIDLTSTQIFDSEYYYLQQNDVVYVQPNNARSGSSNYNQNLSIGVSMISLVITIVALLL